MTGSDLMANLAGLLYEIGSPAGLEAILEKRELLPTMCFSYVLRSALRTWPPDKVYSEFSPLLEGKAGAIKEKREMLEGFVNSTFTRTEQLPKTAEDDERQAAPDTLTWDPRWLNAAIKADSRLMVCWLARPDHSASLNYLLKLGTPKSANHTALTVRALARCQHPKSTEFFLAQVTRKTKGANYVDYELQTLFQAAKHLPPSDLPKLDEFATKLDEKFVDAFLVAIDPLRRPVETT